MPYSELNLPASIRGLLLWLAIGVALWIIGSLIMRKKSKKGSK